MPDRPTLLELLEVQRYLNLPSAALVEKDWYVVRALAAITRLTAEPFQLVFGGGTALSRAHRLTLRMSEDIDFKIVSAHHPSRAELRELRSQVTAALLEAGFVFDPNNPAHRTSRNGSRYTRFQLPYPAGTEGVGALRPEIQIEIAVWPLRCGTVPRQVTSFYAEAFKKSSEVQVVPCASVTEILAEKFVALTRRVGETAARADSERDKTLVRRMYDLCVTRPSYDASELVDLASTIVHDDAEAYGHRLPAYRDDPLRETLNGAATLASDQTYAEQYSEFLRNMF